MEALARSANKMEDGWETDYSGWQALSTLVREAMLDPNVSTRDLDLVAFCWSLAEESEEFMRFASEHNHECIHVLRYLTHHGDPRVRWQAYAAITELLADNVRILEHGAADRDPYARRRALLSWARLRLPGQRLLIDEKSCCAGPIPATGNAGLSRVSSGSPIAF
jgi:hypothetical protein